MGPGSRPGYEGGRYAVARITLVTFSMISPIWSSVMISGGVSTSVSPATRTIRSLSWKALLSPAKPRLPGASASGARVDAGGQADGADIQHARLLPQRHHGVGEFRFEFTSAFEQLFVAIDVERGKPGGAGQWMGRVSVSVRQFHGVFRAAHESVVDGVAHQHAAHRCGTVGDALGEGQHVRHHAVAFGGKGKAKPAKTGDDLVEDQEDAVLLGDLAQPLEIALRRRQHAGRSGHRLDDHGGDGIGAV